MEFLMAIIDFRNRPELLRIEEVMERTGKRRSTIYREVRAGRFPLPVKTGLRSIAWRVEDVSQWILNLTHTSSAGVTK